jgi:putative inorganic carbon (hco3(-)) transporter
MRLQKYQRVSLTHAPSGPARQEGAELRPMIGHRDTTLPLALGLVACLAGGALVFGGTEPLSRAAVESVAFLLFGGTLWSRSARDPQAAWPWQGAALLLAYISVEVAWVRPAGQGAEEEVLRLLASLAVFYVALFVSRRAESLRVLVLGLVALGLFEALYGLVQYTSGWQQIFSYKKVFYVAQATGTYINPNHFAGLLEMIVPLPLALALERLERLERGSHSRARYRASGSEGVAVLVFFLFSALLLLAAILFSRSRAGLVCASVTLVALAAWVKVGWQRSTAALATAWVLAGSLVFGLWLGLGPVVSRYKELGRDSQGRIGVWRDTLALVRMRPVLGWGPGTFPDAFPQVQSVLLNRMVDHAHNDYLEFAAEWGTLGAVLLFGTVLWVLARAAYSCLHLRHRGNRFVHLGCCAGAGALLLHSTVDFNLQIPANALVFAALLGIAYAAVYRVAGNTGAPGDR